MQTMLVKVTTTANIQLEDDDFVSQCMKLLMEKYPVITDYVFERVDETHINIMFWGEDLSLDPD